MSKLLKNIICIIGIILLTIVTILNIVFNSEMSKNEFVEEHINSFFMIVETAILIAIIYSFAKILKHYSKKIKAKYLLFGIVIFIYVLVQIVWVNVRCAKPSADQDMAYVMAKAIREDKVDAILGHIPGYGYVFGDIYFERYSQQFTLAFIWNIMFNILNNTSLFIIQYFNIFSNTLLIITIFLICKELSNKYKVNKYLSLILYITFISLPLLATFIYGDLSSLSFAMLGVYFIMKYTRKRKIRYAIFSSISVAFAYMLRMNILIFILAMIIYLILDLISKKECLKQNAVKVLVIIGFIIITILPSSLTKSFFCKKYGLDKSKNFPTMGYLYMGMSEAIYSPGWFDEDIANIGYFNIENAKEIYLGKIIYRIKYLLSNPLYTLRFYIAKTASMWTETTFSAIRYNISSTYFSSDELTPEFDEKINEMGRYVQLYQKALILIIFSCSIIVIIQNRKDISNEVILLLTIFIGGFLFHTLWEAKSRYVIPYIIALIPLASIEINKVKIIKNKKRENNE